MVQIQRYSDTAIQRSGGGELFFLAMAFNVLAPLLSVHALADAAEMVEHFADDRIEDRVSIIKEFVLSRNQEVNASEEQWSHIVVSRACVMRVGPCRLPWVVPVFFFMG